MASNPLGQSSEYKTQYDPALLFPIARRESRASLGIGDQALPFFGVDVWTGYEISWLNPKGKPCVAVAEFYIPCASPCIIESKSFKLYLNSFNQTVLADTAELTLRLVQDLSRAAGAEVRVELYSLSDTDCVLGRVSPLAGVCVDDEDAVIDSYSPDANCLKVGEAVVEETLYSHLLKTNCPVTGQPDWATLVISYRGRKIDRAGLLKFVVSYREHQDFHEHCVESIYMAIAARCAPETLTVYARYTRRGGLDINPLRSNSIEFDTRMPRLLRQ